MFEQELAEKFKRIFGLQKVTYDQPGESQEQECLFIDVEESKNRFLDQIQMAQVKGTGTIFANADKMPFGFMSKRIKDADHADTKDLFFHDIETNSNRFQNIVQRSFSFIYFYTGQYDPNLGTISTVTIEES